MLHGRSIYGRRPEWDKPMAFLRVIRRELISRPNFQQLSDFGDISLRCSNNQQQSCVEAFGDSKNSPCLT